VISRLEDLQPEHFGLSLGSSKTSSPPMLEMGFSLVPGSAFYLIFAFASLFPCEGSTVVLQLFSAFRLSWLLLVLHPSNLMTMMIGVTFRPYLRRLLIRRLLCRRFLLVSLMPLLLLVLLLPGGGNQT